MRTTTGHCLPSTPILRNLARMVLLVTGLAASITGWSSQPASKQQVATGFFVSDAGYLITAHHVIEGLSDIRVVMSPRQVLRARTIKVDEPNPKMDFEASPLFLSPRARPWIRAADHR